ncbi:hypothetical protein [Paenibacillus sp. HB172176]|uniref:hypothetical protein n=1 Tax=Paenibacillus sp. HB172176 TaxID=2493690 RepID=UPI001439932D|nr:hypothetical protein [Paenibacillus sp. HB172176]
MTWKACALAFLLLMITSCSMNRNTTIETPTSSYIEWKEQIDLLLGGHPYLFPQYQSQVGPLEFVLEHSSANQVDYSLYRSDAYAINHELNGVHTVHDFYYSYSWQQGSSEKIDQSDIYSEFGITNNSGSSLAEYHKDGIEVYQLAEYQKENSEIINEIIRLLNEAHVPAAQILLKNLENEASLDVRITGLAETVEITFSVREANELKLYLKDLGSSYNS